MTQQPHHGCERSTMAHGGVMKRRKPPIGMRGQLGWEERAPTEDSIGTTEILAGL